MTFVRRAVVAAAAASVVILVTSADFALAKEEQRSYIAADGTIQGCVNAKGRLRVVEPDSACRAGEDSVTWNRTGPEGPAGPKGDQGDKGDQGTKGDVGEQGAQGEKGDPGAQGERGEAGVKGESGDKGDKGDTGASGPAGPAGPAGADGVVGAHVVTATKTVAVLDLVDVEARCPDGEIATGGGWYLPGTTAQSYGAALHSNPIVAGSTPVGWTAGFMNGGYEPHYTAAVYAICAQAG
ncbi:hypothetical protein [Streptomyces sp. NPDC001914]|uniref:hypothetical protein n=1 Tax=Streptomyces sp. NPDC001914 TaxID=3364623 RepID=UPI0036C6D4AB